MLSNERKEKISAFLDNDMHPDELMSFSLSSESDDAEIVQRYQMLGDALRGEMSDSSFVDVSHAVREAIAKEEVYADTSHIADQKIADPKGTRVRSKARSASSFFDLSTWLKPVAGMAVAASVAVVMIVTVSEQGTESASPLATSSPVAINVASQPVVNTAMQRTVANTATVNKIKVLNQHVDQRLVNQHLEYATQDALQGRLPLVRAVSYEADK